ncbi:hypothetical protein STENM36S_06811 [Streptomyces tendae]
MRRGLGLAGDAGDRDRLPQGTVRLERAGEAVRLVVLRALVAAVVQVAVTGVGARHGGVRAVHRQLVGIDADAVAVRVAVGEEAALEHLVRGRPDAGHEVRRGEDRLLDLGEDVLRVAVELQLPEPDDRVVRVRPHLGQVERVEAVRRRLGHGHDLHADGPGREVAALDGLTQVALVRVGVLTGELVGLGLGEVLDALVGLEVVLDPEGLARLVVPLVGVRAEAVHVAVRRRDAAVAEQPGDLVRRLRRQAPEVPDVVHLGRTRVGVALLGADEVGELDGVLDEEHRGVVADEVVVALLGVELQREAARVADGVRRTQVAGHGGEAEEGLRLLADLGEEGRARVPGDVGGDREGAIGAGAAGVHDALRDALTVEVGQLLQRSWSWTSTGPPTPAVSLFWLSATGAPVSVVSGP